MSKTSKFRKIMDRSAYLWLSVAAFFVCMLSYVPLAAAQGAHVTAMGQQTMDRFLCDLPYVVSLPVALLLAAILAVCAVRGKGKRPLVYWVVVFLLVFMLWMVSSSQLLAAKLAGTVALYRVAEFFLYLVLRRPISSCLKRLRRNIGSGSACSSFPMPLSLCWRPARISLAFLAYRCASRCITRCCWFSRPMSCL